MRSRVGVRGHSGEPSVAVAPASAAEGEEAGAEEAGADDAPDDGAEDAAGPSGDPLEQPVSAIAATSAAAASGRRRRAGRDESTGPG